MSLSAQVAEFYRRHGLENKAGVVAASGGPDSVALAHLLVGLLQEGKFPRLALGHVNHQLRGAESDDDEDFVKSLPALWQMENDLRLTCHTQHIDVAAIAGAEKANLEGIARRERYRWLTQLAHATGASWIATGHSADDQAETVLFRLLRGSGILGLGGIPRCRPLGQDLLLVRPCLIQRRQVLLDYLHVKSVPYRLDSSNRDTCFTRNRLRLELLPQLAKNYNPDIVNVLCRLAEQAHDLHEEITPAAAQLLTEAEFPRAGKILVFSVDRLKNASPNLVREMFRLVWPREGWPMGDMDFLRWNRMTEIVFGTRSAWDFPGKIHMRRVGSVVQIHPSPPADEPASQDQLPTG
jgi:tRNA(Ile)-lysidine synthase